MCHFWYSLGTIPANLKLTGDPSYLPFSYLSVITKFALQFTVTNYEMQTLHIILVTYLPNNISPFHQFPKKILLSQHLSLLHSTLYLLPDLNQLFEMKFRWYLLLLVKKNVTKKIPVVTACRTQADTLGECFIDRLIHDGKQMALPICLRYK